MSEPFDSAFDVGQGLVFNDENGNRAGIFFGVGNPDVEVPDAPTSSIYLRSDGKVFKRGSFTTTGDPTDWGEGTGGTTGSSQYVPFCLEDGTVSNIPLINGQMPFYLTDGSPSFIGVI